VIFGGGGRSGAAFFFGFGGTARFATRVGGGAWATGADATGAQLAATASNKSDFADNEAKREGVTKS
jgi:hypothetical protein